ncbi:cystathionine gamma-synthase [Haloferula luteola]|uniref:Cystathionine gamma-synthase n=1 Tax=Haloferula luteola TaxID=595692 RepID=A0A840UY56_9BACT|nr:PLP-dependent transferase [Haloferula luteola]MBB5350712.1 cystathionine gamma-synthase [Haloferula luteola]
MRDFIQQPAWTEADLGLPLPDSAHACSVALPTWSAVIGYEEGRDKVIRRMRAGYPRFFTNPLVSRLTAQASHEIGGVGEAVFLFPSKGSAQRAQRWIERQSGGAVRAAGFDPFHAVVVPEGVAGVARDYQRFSGELVSSRAAEDFFEGGVQMGDKSHLVKRRLAGLYGASADHISVYGSGMSAVMAVMRSLPGVAEGKKTLQLEFPYVDSLKVQELFGTGVVFLGQTEGESFDEALQRIRQGEFAGVFTEVPSNPLLRCPDLQQVSEACREGGIPLIVDDSAVGPYNVQVLPWADVVTASLTKWISGAGDVMAGAVVVREDSPFATDFLPALERESQEGAPLYVGDAQVLLANMKDFKERMTRPNQTALRLVGMLGAHPAVESVWHPSVVHRDRYERVKTPHGGFGGLFSFKLKAPKKSPKFFDALAVSKGPSFGTSFTLASPYVMLAHYHERDWAAGCGVPESLIRVSVGQEDPQHLEEVFLTALEAI